MDDLENLNSKEEIRLARELDKCAFIYGEEFTKFTEASRSILAEKKQPEISQTEERTRVHIDLGESKNKKVSPTPESTEKKLTIDKKPKN
ncbi:MAG: hypothetical protein LUI60_04045 [Clostridia bacterium]|nr:hypothetical protein [Clostridia bacterium]